MPLTHRPDRDGSAVRSRHVPYYLALEVMALAWAQLLDEVGGGVLRAGDVGVVHVEFDFSRELFVGEADVDAEVVAVGRSSVAFSLVMHQEGRLAATGRTVVARTDQTREHSLPLTEEQREALNRVVA